MASMIAMTNQDCRICKTSGSLLMSVKVTPCACAAPVHRDCLNKQRIYATSEDAFSTCSTCNTKYKFVPVPTPSALACGYMCKYQCLYRLTMIRDFLTMLAIIAGIFGLMGVVLYFADDHMVTDKIVPKIMQGKVCMFADDWNGLEYQAAVSLGAEGEEIPEIPGEIPCYAVGGVAVFFILVSCCMCTYTLFDKCCGGDGDAHGDCCSSWCGEKSSCNAIYCCWWGDPCYTSHYYGLGPGGSSVGDGCCVCCFENGDCLGTEGNCCATCDCTDACNAGGGDCDCGDDAGGIIIVIVVVALIIMIAVGFFLSVYLAIMIFSSIAARNAQIARNRLESKQQWLIDSSEAGNGEKTSNSNVVSNPIFSEPTGEGFVVTSPN